MKMVIFEKGFNYSQDGPGNRLVYHLSGCNMYCPWCSNPEGMSTKGKEYSTDDIKKEIISAFTKNGTGTVVGYSLYNAVNLTTQVAKTVDVMSSVLEGFTKTIRNITVHQVQIDYSESIQNMIHALEVLQNYYTIQDINHSAFITFTKKLADAYNEKAFKAVISTINYKKSTIAFLQEILNFYGRENNLNIYLSALSEYKHPRMEELYETTQI